MIELKIADVDSGFCRIVYKTKNKDNEYLYYALQYDGPKDGISLYRCTDDGEPSHKVSFKSHASFQEPNGDSSIEVRVREYLKAKKELYSEMFATW